MSSGGVRRSDRVSVTIHLTAEGEDAAGRRFVTPARTIVVGRAGALIVVDRELRAGQELILHLQPSGVPARQGRAKVVGAAAGQGRDYTYGVALEPDQDFWGIDFPQPAESARALARALFACSSCGTREVAYLSERELRAFEVSRVVARDCTVCDGPTVWTQAAKEPKEEPLPSEAGGEKRSERQAARGSAERRDDHRKNARVHSRLTACVRRAGKEELAVCEDLSGGGVCFRSRTRYAAGSTIEIAVPYSEVMANIFIPARVARVEEIRGVGLFRHGAEYLRSAPGTPTGQGGEEEDDC